MLRVFIKIAFLLILSFNLFGQEDSIPTFLELYTPEKCKSPTLAVLLPLVEEGKRNSQVYFRVNESKFSKNIGLSFKVNSKKSGKLIRIKQNEYLIRNLNKNDIISIFGLNSCKEKIELGKIKVVIDTLEGIEVSPEMFKLVDLFSKQKEDLVSFLARDNKVSVFEKISFVQKYLIRGEIKKNTPREENGENGFVGGFINPGIPSPPIINPARTCYCQIVKATTAVSIGQQVITNPSNEPSNYGGYYWGNGFIQSEDINDTAWWNDGNVNKGKWYHNSYIKGPAKRIENYSYGRRQGSSYSIFDHLGGIYSQTSMTWLCSNFAIPSNCSCNLKVKYDASYNTRLQSKLELISGLFCKNKGGRSKAEDWTTLSLMDEDTIIVLAAGNGTVESECSSSFNNEFLIATLDVALDLAKTYIELKGLSIDSLGGSIDSLLGTNVVDDLKENIEILLNTPLTLTSGCYLKDVSDNLISKKGTFYLEPNKSRHLLMNSWDKTYVYGWNCWSGHAIVTSDFHVSVAVKPRYPRTCCYDGVGSWAMGWFPGESHATTGHRNLVRQFLYHNNLPYDNTELGSRWVDVPCSDGGSDFGRKSNDIEQSVLFSSDLKIQVFDVLGKIRYEDVLLLPSGLDNYQVPLGKGLNFIKITKDGKTRIEKVFNINQKQTYEIKL